jgi:hypothetical protein
MKKVTRIIFLFTVLVMMLALSMTAYAEPEDKSNEVKLDYKIRGFSYVKFYISESQTQAGTLLVNGTRDLDIYTGSTYLKPGKTYYLNMLVSIDGMLPEFAGKFDLNGSGLQFTNNSKQLLTNPTDFRAYEKGIGYGLCKTIYEYKYSTTIPGVTYIVAQGGGREVWFSATIIPEQSVLKVQAIDSSKGVDLTWNAIPGAASYSVERSMTPGGPYTPIISDLTETSYADKNVTANTTYYYIVKAKMSDTETITSAEVSATPTTETPTIESKLKVVLEPTESLQLSVDDNLAINTNMTWTSSDNTVATVNEKGVVTALAPGNTVITVKSPDGTYTDYINVLVVEDASDYRLAIDLKVGQSARLTVDDLTNTVNATWEPMDSAIANVTSKGKVTALKKGLVLFTAKDEEGIVIGKVYVRVRE